TSVRPERNERGPDQFVVVEHEDFAVVAPEEFASHEVGGLQGSEYVADPMATHPEQLSEASLGCAERAASGLSPLRLAYQLHKQPERCEWVGSIDASELLDGEGDAGDLQL